MSIEDIITESLENDNLQLQNMSGQKYVQTNPMFLDAVAKWQKNLGTVDSVLSCWMDVQKKWQALESIFIGSADIRVQLPEDSKRFDAINADFQDLMRNAPDITNVVDACNLEGRQERLENMLSQLEICEKALQVRAWRRWSLVALFLDPTDPRPHGVTSDITPKLLLPPCLLWGLCNHVFVLTRD
jgi:dynein heavy chain